MTARVSQFEFSYGSPVVPGRMLVHLNFYLNSYNGLNATDVVFPVTGTAYNRFNATNDKFFFLPVDGDTLTIKFTPSTNYSNAYAFVNGIEVMFMPDIYKNGDGTLILVGENSLIYIDNTTALENVLSYKRRWK
ncbi:hypothetical protein Dsin_011558 [Dipteronia sinensis]|uniref:Uncharacterized protein n=1 Tax=Dipteronia sinensis TaxID=43782 RepID=A0AAE0AUK7_9ROSI|nr:hypothetical protein Dsin_011558 [Dipteronia sinensis]